MSNQNHKWQRRQQKQDKSRYGMKVNGRSVKTVLQFKTGVKKSKRGKK